MDVFGFHLGDVDLRQKFQAQSGLIPDSFASSQALERLRGQQ